MYLGQLHFSIVNVLMMHIIHYTLRKLFKVHSITAVYKIVRREAVVSK